MRYRITEAGQAYLAARAEEAAREAHRARLASLWQRYGPGKDHGCGVGDGSPVSLPPLPDDADACPAAEAIPESIFSELHDPTPYSEGPLMTFMPFACAHDYEFLRRETYAEPDPAFAGATLEGGRDVVYCRRCTDVRHINAILTCRRLADNSIVWFDRAMTARP